MKLKFTRKTWYFFLLAAAAVSMLGGFAVLGGMDFSGLEMIVFCITGIACCFWPHRRAHRQGKAQLHAGVRAADAQQAGCQRLGGRPVLGTGVACPAGIEYEHGKPIQRQLQLVCAAEVLRLVFWLLTATRA